MGRSFALCFVCFTILSCGRGGGLQGLRGKDPASQCRGVQIAPLLRDDPLEREMVTHSSILAWEIPWTEEESGRLQSMGSQRVSHNLMTRKQQHGRVAGEDRFTRDVFLRRVLGDCSFSVKNKAGMPRVNQ